jgi:hypothetical protein
MDEWWREQVASGFAAFQGAHVAGSVPISDRWLNELIQEWLAAAARPAAAAVERQPRPALDLAAVARLVRRVTVRASEGVVTVDFEMGV